MGLSFNWAYSKWPITTTGKAFKGPAYNLLIIGISGHDCVELSMSWSLVSVIVFKYRYFFTGYVAWAQHLTASCWTPRKSCAVFGTFLADLFYFAHTFYPILGLFWTWASKHHYSWCPLNIFQGPITTPAPARDVIKELHWPLGTQHLLDFTATGSTNTLTLREDDQRLVLEVVSVVPWPIAMWEENGEWPGEFGPQPDVEQMLRLWMKQKSWPFRLFQSWI